MTTEALKSMTVEHLQRLIENAILCCEHDYTAWTAQEAFDELARRLEEAQQRNAAHDAKVAAEAKAKALEEARKDYSGVAGAFQAWEIVKHLTDKAAEYRAKATEAGRKE